MDMGRFKSLAGNALGALVVGGLFFSQCVYPIFRDDSIEARCSDPELSQMCDEPGTIGNFFVVVCGRDNVIVKGDLIRTIGGDPGVREPSDVVGEIWCGKKRYLRIEVPEDRKASGYEDLKRSLVGSSSKQVIVVYEDWTSGKIRTEEARRRLLAID